MDKSRAIALLGEHLKPLSEFLCLSHWTFCIRCEALEENKRAIVEIDADYDQATIRFDHDKAESDGDLLDSLFHELAHIVLAPYEVYFQFATAHVQVGTPSDHAERRIRTHCGEQAVIALERIWRCEMKSIYLDKFTCP